MKQFNGVPAIRNGYMAAPCLLFRTEYRIFKRKGFRPKREKNKKWTVILKAAF